jgi:DNA polymerase theta
MSVPTVQFTPNWQKYFEICIEFADDYLLISETIGINFGFLSQLSKGFSTSHNTERMQIHVRFFNALIVFDLIREVPMNDISRKYGVTRGTLQSIQTMSGTFCGMIRILCGHLNLKQFDVLFLQLQDRLKFGVEQELLQLSMIEGVSRKRAKHFYQLGFKSPNHLSDSDPIDIFKALEEIETGTLEKVLFKEARSIIKNAKDFLWESGNSK